jgi:hypothetical protein
MSDPKRNPGWKRPADWKYEEDWNSPAWNERMKKVREELAAKREAYGFDVCPACETEHTTKTLVCRNCGYANPRPDGPS